MPVVNLIIKQKHYVLLRTVEHFSKHYIVFNIELQSFSFTGVDQKKETQSQPCDLVFLQVC